MHKALHNRHFYINIVSYVSALIILSALFIFTAPVIHAYAESQGNSNNSNNSKSTVYTNEDTGYQIIYEDDADLIDEEDVDSLINIMKPITEYGNVAFKSTLSNPYSSTERYASNYYSSKFGYSSGTVFIIDMDERTLWIHSDGKVYSTITTSYANTITDNVYTYASAGNYFLCSYKVFEQEAALLQGSRISQPMRFITNSLIALIIAILINYVIVRTSARKRKANHKDILNGVFVNNAFNNPNVELVRHSSVYSPPSSSSGSGGHSSGGGGGGSSHSSGGGGGSHSSGGGGGHRF